MKRVQLIFAVIAAVVGIGAAYAYQPKNTKTYIPYHWYTPGGHFIFFASTVMARQRCINAGVMTCLIGTVIGASPIIILGTFQ